MCVSLFIIHYHQTIFYVRNFTQRNEQEASLVSHLVKKCSMSKCLYEN